MDISLPQLRLPRRRLLLGAAAIAAVSGCGRTDRTDPPLRVLLLHTWQGDPALAAAAAAVTARTGREVRLETVPGEEYGNVLAAGLASGSPPDLIEVRRFGEHDLAVLARQGALLPLDPYDGDPLSLTDALQPALDLGLVEGSRYAVTEAVTAPAMLARVRTLAAAGEGVPTEPPTWSEFFDLCVRISAATGEHTYGVDNYLGTWEQGVRTHGALGYWLRQRGKSLFTADGQLGFDPADLADWFTYWLELAEAGGCPAGAPDLHDPESGRTWGSAFESAFRFGDAYWYAQQADSDFGPEYRLARMPRADGAGIESGYAYAGTTLLAVPAGVADPDAAVGLLQALVLDPEIAPELHQRVWLGAPVSAPVRDALRHQPHIGAGYQEAAGYVADLADEVGAATASPATVFLVLEELTHASAEVGTGQVPVAEGVDSFFTAASGLL